MSTSSLLVLLFTLVTSPWQSPADPVVGTWRGPAACLHGGGETFTMGLARQPDGAYEGTMDWARSSSDGRHAPGVPFTTVQVDGRTIEATTTVGARTIRLHATIDGDAIEGRWATDGDQDRWTFEGTRQAR